MTGLEPPDSDWQARRQAEQDCGNASALASAVILAVVFIGIVVAILWRIA